MRHRFAVLCKSTIVEEQSRSLSIIGIVDRLTVDLSKVNEEVIEQSEKKHQVIMIPTTATLVVCVERTRLDQPEQEKILMRSIIGTPGGHFSQSQEVEIDLEQNSTVRNIFELDEFPFTVNGVYLFNVQYKIGSQEWEIEDSLPLIVSSEDSSTVTTHLLD